MPRSSWSAPMRRKARDRAFGHYAARVLAAPEQHHRLAVERVRANLTAGELASAASTTSKTISNMEHDRSPGTRLSRDRVARAVGVSVESIWGPR